MSAANQLPLACSLSGAELAARRREIREVVARALIGSERGRADLRLRFARSPSVVDAVEDLVRRERECCPFLHFEIIEGASELVLSIRAPAGAAAVLDEFAALAA
jgi:hypothetical protein